MKTYLPVAAPGFALALFAFSGCGSGEIGLDPNHVVLAGREARPGSSFFVVNFSSTAATFAEEMTASTGGVTVGYDVLLDGLVVASDYGGPVHAATVSEGGSNLVGYLDSGLHHFVIKRVGGTPIFEGDGELLDGGSTRLFLYGPMDALQGFFHSLPSAPAAGKAHVSVVNLERSGRQLEVVSCTDATACMPISGALALGDLFDTEVPDDFDDCVSTLSASYTCVSSRTAGGAGIGYRLVPSASLANPPVGTLSRTRINNSGTAPPPAIFVAGPWFFDDQGYPMRGLDY